MAVSVDKGKLLEQAQKYIQKGQIDKAIAEYQKVVEADPRDLRTLLKIGDLSLKKGDKATAANTYSKAADLYGADGFNLQAIAVYKQLLKVDPSIYEIYPKLAELYRKQGLIADALAQYRIVIGNYEKQGKAKEAIDVLRQMATLDPENFSIRAKLAELSFRSGDKKGALEEYSRIASDLKNKGRTDDVIILYEKLLSGDPACTFAQREIAEVYLRTGKKKEALSSLQAVIKADPSDKKALLLLADAYLDMNETGSARVSYEGVLRIDPSSVDARKGFSRILLKGGDREGAVKAMIPVADMAIGEKNYDIALGIMFEFYREEVREPALLEKMADIYGLKGEEEKAKGIRSELADAYEKRGDRAKAEGIRRELRPKVEEVKEVEKAEEAPVEELTLEEHFVLPEAAAPEVPKESVLRYITEAEVYFKYGLKDKAIEILKSAASAFPEDINVHKRLKEAYEQSDKKGDAAGELVLIAGLAVKTGNKDEALAYLSEALRFNPSLDEAQRMLSSLKGGEPAGEVEEISLEVSEEAPEFEVVEEVHEKALETTAEIPAARVTEELEEAQFYIEQGLYDEAREVCERILQSNPGNKETLSKLKEIANALSSRAVEEKPSVEKTPEEGFFDLAAELEGEDFDVLTMPPGMKEAERFGFEDIFSEFKKGVDSQLGKEDVETHYNLGIAYKEMGLLDDAIREFKIASADPKKEFDCYSLIGICYIDMGNFPKAIDVFKKGLGLPGRADDEYASLNYEIGRACEMSGMASEALAAYTEAKKKAPGFRDVEAKIMSLGGGGREVRKGRVSYV